MTAHSRIGASSMYRWSACPGSVRLSADVAKKSSAYAEEGSDAHALAAECLLKQTDPLKYIGCDVKIDGRAFRVDRDMAEAVSVYIDDIRSSAEHGDEDFIEQRFDLTEVHAGCFGTADHVRWRPSKGLLIVRDYKHGAGLPVNVFENSQLKYYALGALLALKLPAKKVRMVICQPRCDHADGPIRHYEIDAIDLLDFKTDLKAFAVATEAADAPLVPGDHCRFCPAAALCPALKTRAQTLAKLEFSKAVPYDPAELKLALDSREPLKAWIKALDEFAYAEAEAGRGEAFGYKLVDKRAIRRYADEGAVIEALQDRQVPDDTIFEPRSVRSPAQLEKDLGKKIWSTLEDELTAKRRDLLGDDAPPVKLIISESSGHTLVPLDDKRPAVTRSAKDDFAALPKT